MQTPNNGILDKRIEEYVKDQEQAVFVRTDKSFRILLAVEWVGGILTALFISPRTWSGEMASVHLHLWTATLLGGVIVSLPILLAFTKPGTKASRYSIACSQMLFGALLIHLMAGRIEAHFYVFGSLAFLATYRQWQVLIPATVIVALDHIIRGIYWPQSVYGVITGAEWRFLEHAAWVIFEDIFLIIAIIQGQKDMRQIATSSATLVQTNKELEKKNSEAEVAREIAEKANVAKSIFLANMSHELRTPLHGILSFARFGLKDINKGKKDSFDKYFQEIKDSGDGLLFLLNDLLDLSKLSAGKMEYNFELNEIGQVVDTIKSQMALIAKRKKISIVTDISTPATEFDRNRIAQVIRNLISNAIKFSDNDGSIKVESKRKGDQIEVRVYNKGVEIPSDELESIFDSFKQSSKTKSGAGGTGLGLAISKQIVTQHQGKIWAESDKNGNTVFTFTIPQKITKTDTTINTGPKIVAADEEKRAA